MARIDEVAKAAGVSISTVSYALSGKRPVAADTRRRIEDAVRALGYRPNAGARMLAGRRTQIFAVSEPLHAYTHAPTHMAFALGMSIAARARDYDILLLTDAEASRGMRRVADSGLVDAVLALDVAPDDERVALARELAVPVVFVGVPNDNDGLVCVDLDFEAAAGTAVDALADAGHRDLMLLGHPAPSYAISNFAPRVRDGFAAAAQRRGVAGHFRSFDPQRTGAAQVHAYLTDALEAGVTALVLHNNSEIHELVLRDLAARGLRVPKDMSVISVGGTADTTRLDPPLTALPLVPERSCERAIELAAAAVEGDAVAPGIHLIDPVVVDLGSVAAPASR